jgi:transposase
MRTLALKMRYDVKQMERMYREAADKRTAQRLKAICLRAKGKSPPEIAAIMCRHAQTIRNWIKLFNEGGPALLVYKHSGGRSRKLGKEQEDMIARWLNEGTPGGGRWTLSRLREKLLGEYGMEISQQQLSQTISRLGLTHLTSRPRRRKTD